MNPCHLQQFFPYWWQIGLQWGFLQIESTLHLLSLRKSSWYDPTPDHYPLKPTEFIPCVDACLRKITRSDSSCSKRLTQVSHGVKVCVCSPAQVLLLQCKLEAVSLQFVVFQLFNTSTWKRRLKPDTASAKDQVSGKCSFLGHFTRALSASSNFSCHLPKAPLLCMDPSPEAAAAE